MSIFGSLSFPYHEPRDGFWGEKTVTLNFCEEDYVISYYCAELCNTLTNIAFIWLGLRGLRDCLRFSHPTIFVVAFVGYMIVGVGSSLFHATLKYPMQLVDELSMIYTTCLMCFATFSYRRSALWTTALGLGLAALSWFITARYYHTRDPKFHQAAYGILTTVVVLANVWVMERSVRPALRRRQADRAPNSTVPPADAIMGEMWVMVVTGLSIFIGGYLIWNLDNIFCHEIRGWRRIVQLPWAIVLEGHAWWHLMTGIAYYYIVWRVWIYRCLEGEEDKYRLRWPSVWSLPDVVARDIVTLGPTGKKRH